MLSLDTDAMREAVLQQLLSIYYIIIMISFLVRVSSLCVCACVCVAFYSFAFPPFLLLCCYFEIHHDFEIKHSTSMMRKMESSMSKHIGFGTALPLSLPLHRYLSSGICVRMWCVYPPYMNIMNWSLFNFIHLLPSTLIIRIEEQKVATHICTERNTNAHAIMCLIETHNIWNNELDCGDDMILNQHWKSIISLCTWKTSEGIAHHPLLPPLLALQLNSWKNLEHMNLRRGKTIRHDS